MDAIKAEDSTSDLLKDFADCFSLIPREIFYKSLFFDLKLIKFADRLFDRLEEAEEESARLDIKKQVESLISAFKNNDYFAAYLFRLETCEPTLRAIKSEYRKDIVNKQKIVSLILDLTFSLRSRSTAQYAIAIKTLSKILAPDRDVPPDAEFYSQLRFLDPNGRIREEIEIVEKKFKNCTLWLSHSIVTDFCSLGIQMNKYLPHAFQKCRGELLNGGVCRNESDRAKSATILDLLENNAAGKDYVIPKSLTSVSLELSQSLPKEITIDDVKKLSFDEKKTLFYGEIHLCNRMDASILLQMDEEDVNRVSGECLACMKRFCGEDALDLSSIVPKLPDSSFTHAYHRLNPKTFLAMRPEQIRRFGGGSEVVPIELVTDQLFLKYLRPYVIAYTMENNAQIFQGERLAVLYDYLDKESQKHQEDNNSACSKVNILQFFDNLTANVDDDQHKQDYVRNIPGSCWKLMKGIYQLADVPATNIAHILPYMDSRFFSTVKVGDLLHEETFKALTPALAANFGIESNFGSVELDFNIIEDDNALNRIPTKHIAYSLYSFPACLDRLTHERIIQLINDEGPEALSIPIEWMQNYLETIAVEKLFEMLKYRNIAKYTLKLPDDIFSFLSMRQFDGVSEEDGRLILSHITPSQIREIKGFCQKDDSDAIDLSPYFDILPAYTFHSLPRGLIHQDTIKNMPPKISLLFGKRNPEACGGYDFSMMGKDALSVLSALCLRASLSSAEHRQLMSDESLLFIMESKSVLCGIFPFAYLRGRFDVDILSLLPFSCLNVVPGFWDRDNYLKICPSLPLSFFQNSTIPPKEEVLDCNDHAAANWALNNPEVCGQIEESFPLSYVHRLPVTCQAYYFKEDKNFHKLDLKTIKNEVFKVFVHLKVFDNASWSYILEIPKHLRQFVTPRVFHTLSNLKEDLLSEVDLEGFNHDIFTLIKRPLPTSVLQKLEPRFLTYRLCLFHYADELPEEAKRDPNWLYKLTFIKNTFRDRAFFKKELFDGLDILLSPLDGKFNDEEFELLNNLDRKLHDIWNVAEDKGVFYNFLHEVIATFDPIDHPIRLEKINELRNVHPELKVIYNLLITSPRYLLPSMEKYPLLNPVAAFTVDFTNYACPDTGMIYPKSLYKAIVLHWETLALHATAIRLPGDALGIGVSRAFVDQCVKFIFDGPDKDVHEQEMRARNEPVSVHLNPLLDAPGKKPFSFFPYRAHRNIGKFVAYTIVKALQCEATTGINLDEQFYEKLAIVRDENEMTDDERRDLNQYHDTVFCGPSSLENLLYDMKEYFYDGDYLPRTDHFCTPFGPRVATRYADTEEKQQDGVLYEQVMGVNKEEYFERYRQSTYAEFRALMLSFKLVFEKAFDIYRLSHLWNLHLWTELMGSGDLDLNSDQVFAAIRKSNNREIYDINSLVRNKKSGKIYEVNFYDAVKQFLDRLNNKQLGGIVAMFMGTSRVPLTPERFSFSFDDLLDNYTVSGDMAFQTKMLTREDLERIINEIYMEQLEALVGETDRSECEMVTSPTFPRSQGHACYGTLDLRLGLNNYQLLFVFAQQINAPRGILYE